ncbi:hypothetical protein EG68_08979 [Paragonimus skrjabini miyazakii]|uniref:Uncharacterized protein n=1 Tax=Paragonimus skrjabini miyazakii TaxID=59628 RepID=A0A8S9YM56_9TREM|nr:hypothetical protein EG68_08979 [Paragonimus skrjabini miyazakii]
MSADSVPNSAVTLVLITGNPLMVYDADNNVIGTNHRKRTSTEIVRSIAVEARLSLTSVDILLSLEGTVARVTVGCTHSVWNTTGVRFYVHRGWGVCSLRFV